MGNPPPTGYLFVKKIHGTVRVKISIVYFYGNLSETMDVPVEEVSSDYSDDSPNERTTTPPTQIEPKCSRSNWSKWSRGSAFCDPSNKQRIRSCKCGYLVRPATKCRGGTNIEIRPVSLMSCYSWTIWGAWSATSQTCGDACRDILALRMHDNQGRLEDGTEDTRDN